MLIYRHTYKYIPDLQLSTGCTSWSHRESRVEPSSDDDNDENYGDNHMYTDMYINT
jgi:hypothetical protein